MGSFTGLWIDDVIPVPDGLVTVNWTGARSGWEGLFKLELLKFTDVSISKNLNSKIGDNRISCMNVIFWLDQRRQNGLFVPQNIFIHVDEDIGQRFNFINTYKDISYDFS